MILENLHVDPGVFEAGTGWLIKPEGACRDDRCVPLPLHATADGRLDVNVLAERIGMPLVQDVSTSVWALGPEAGSRSLSSAHAPALVLPDVNGQPFDLASLHGTKVLLVAWASW